MRLGYTEGAHYFVEFYHHVARLLGGGPHSVAQTTQCDVFFYTYWNAQDIQRCARGTKLVFISGECWDTAKFPRSLLIDCKQVDRPGSAFLYYPFYALSLFEHRPVISPTSLLKPATLDPPALLAQKTRFCAFMYSHDVDFRVQLFDDVNRYRPVDALGKSRNNQVRPDTDRGNPLYMDSAVAKYRPYKFVICCENKRFPGYVTEKIINAMLAHAIPIYLGAPDVASHFNPRSFIDVGAFPSRAAALEYIQKVDQDDEMYVAMLREPWFPQNTLPAYFEPSYLQRAFESLPAVPFSLAQPRSRSPPPRGRVLGRSPSRSPFSFSTRPTFLRSTLRALPPSRRGVRLSRHSPLARSPLRYRSTLQRRHYRSQASFSGKP